ADVVALRSGGGRELVEALATGQRRAERGGERLLGAGRVARDRGGVGVQRRRAAGRYAQLDVVAAHALANPQVEARAVVDRLGAEHEHGVGELDVGEGRLQLGVVERGVQIARQRRAEPRVDVV